MNKGNYTDLSEYFHYSTYLFHYYKFFCQIRLIGNFIMYNKLKKNNIKKLKVYLLVIYETYKVRFLK